MRTATGLFSRLCEPAHIDQAIRLASRGKRRRPDVAACLFLQDRMRYELVEGLATGTWRPEGFELRRIRDPKRRVIAVAPFRDRVVHTALVLLLEPVFTPRLVAGDLACRVGGGPQRAVLALQREMRRYPVVIHLDIRAYFPSIELDILRGLLARYVRDRSFLEVTGHVLDSGAGLLDEPRLRSWIGVDQSWPPPGRGLPVGAHTSQFLATHVNLLGLDHFIKRQLRVRGYVRYVDDLFLFGHRRAELREWREAVGHWLLDERQLRLKAPEAPVLRCAGTLHALGHRIRRDGIEVSRRSMRRMKARVDTAVRSGWGKERLERSMASSVGLLLGP